MEPTANIQISTTQIFCSVFALGILILGGMAALIKTMFLARLDNQDNKIREGIDAFQSSISSLTDCIKLVDYKREKLQRDFDITYGELKGKGYIDSGKHRAINEEDSQGPCGKTKK